MLYVKNISLLLSFDSFTDITINVSNNLKLNF